MYYKPGLLSALRAARAYQKGGPPLPYATLRMLEKKSNLLVVYRKLNEWTDYPAPVKGNPGRTVRRRTHYTVVLTSHGLTLLGFDTDG